ncbi:hypothetical protein JJD41_20635 [Oxynema sp. CENA135]|uniref:hypothetical protein n=1 Tax=Oxynema sp. CENA135 TaxID=984206 RepID=UPI00190C2213|nr:hypothetical protein [Oxynema sp. CENA135]MBK4732255.1 hypothetical protein [Oxynema sp. CENA135]
MPLFQAPTELKERARQGEPEAISAIVNQAIQSEGITAKAAIKDGSLLLLLEAAQIPDRESLVPFIQQGVRELAIEPYSTMKVYGRQQGQRHPAWQQEIEIEPPMSVPVEEEDDDIPDDEFDLSDEGDDMAGAGFELVGDDDLAEDMEDEDLGDDEEHYIEDDYNLDDELEEDAEVGLDDEEPSAKKGMNKKLAIAIPVVVLLLTGAGVGGWWYYQQQFNSQQATPTSPTPEGGSPAATETPTGETTPAPTATATPTPTATETPADPFAEAVRKATQAAQLAQTAETQAQWNQVANLWQQASDLMNAVPESSANYSQAQPRVETYRQNMEVARQRAANSP